MFVYRLLNEEEDPNNGLVAKDPHADVEIEDHVGYGSQTGQHSQFISTTKTYENIFRFTMKSYKKFVRVVRINLSPLRRRHNVDIIDLSDPETRHAYIDDPRASIFARNNKEVLVVGYIPHYCIELIYSGRKNRMPYLEEDLEC